MTDTRVNARIKLIYILGSGRCGSTLLDIVLGSHPDIQSTGELDKVPFPAWTSEGPCSCGELSARCDFWSDVRTRFASQCSEDGMLDAQREFERYRSLPRLILGRIFQTRRFKEHRHGMEVLADSILAASGRRILVDSSNNPIRALVWANCPGVDAYFVHLVRDGRGFIASRRKDPEPFWNRSVLRTSALWLISNLVSSVLFAWRRGRYLLVRYEDLVGDPNAVLGRIGVFLGLPMDLVFDQLRGSEGVTPGHVVGGNRMRSSGKVILRPDVGWQRTLSANDRRVFWRAAGLLARAYGYRRDAATHPEERATRQSYGL